MKIRYISDYISKIFAAAVMLCVALSFGSCDRLHEDLQPCPQGVRLRFVYYYNLEDANAFPSQVDCLTLLVYDKDGNYIRTLHAARPETQDEDWRMTIDLPAGEYNMLAYGGMDCEKSTFRFSTSPAETLMQNLQVYLPDDLITEPDGTDLHPLFYGRLNVTVPEMTPDSDYVEETVYMMKDTNDIRVLLANEHGKPTNGDDFIFTITDNNTRFNYLNDIISTDTVTYYQWDKGTTNGAVLPNGRPYEMAWAQLSVPRLMENSKAVLYVHTTDGKQVAKVDLVTVLLMLRDEHFDEWGDQEFLDRQSRWSLAFFLTDNGVWTEVDIVINGWVVRINNISDF